MDKNNIIHFQEQRDWVQNFSEFEYWVLELSEWYQKYIENNQDEQMLLDNFGEGLISPIKKLSRQEFPVILKEKPLSESLKKEIEHSIFENNHKDTNGAWLVGAALAKFANSRKNDVVSLATAWKLTEGNFTSKYSFMETFQKHLGDELLQTLENLILLIVQHPKAMIYTSDKEYLPSALNDIRNAESIRITWHYYEMTPHLECNFISLLSSLRSNHLNDYFTLLDKLGIPQFIQKAYFASYNSKNDFQEYLRLLTHAPSSFTEQKKWNGTFTTPMLLKETYEAILHIAKDPNPASKIIQDKVNQPLNDLAQTVLNREDGIPLACFWLSELIHNWYPSKHSSEYHKTIAEIQDAAIDHFITALANKVSNPKTIKNILAFDEDKSESPEANNWNTLLIIILTLSETSQTQKHQSYLIELYEEMLCNNKTLSPRHEEPWHIQWPESHLAGIFLNTESPSTSWYSMWNNHRLIEKRRDRLFYAYTNEEQKKDAEQIHALVGLALIDHLISPETQNAQEALCLFKTLLDSILYEPQVLRHDQLPIFVGSLFARLPTIIKLDSSLEEYNQIGEQLKKLGGDYELIAISSLGLSLNGCNIKELELDAFELDGKRLYEAVQAYLEWENRPNGKRNSLNWPTQLKAVLQR